MDSAEILTALDVYMRRLPSEKATVAQIRAFVVTQPRWFDRALRIGHLTGSAWVLDSDLRTAALVHHRKFDRWVQPGGHVEPTDPSIFATARREAEEELGLADLAPLSRDIYDIDIHEIPQRGDEPAHLHYDVRYAFTTPLRTLVVSAESTDVRWIPLDALAQFGIDASVRRLIAKTPLLADVRSAP